jgi:hypothetical protein
MAAIVVFGAAGGAAPVTGTQTLRARRSSISTDTPATV